MACPVGCLGTMMKCSFGVAPASHVVLPVARVMVCKKPAANIMEQKPIANMPPFGMCMSLANPMVAAATAAAFGVLVPMPCLPVIPAPWVPSNPTRLIAKMPTQGQTSLVVCAWGGVITPLVPGQFQVMA